MIRRLQLHNWRAYENLDLELGPGATFIVASNGIGKTSLIMGAAWGLFGDASGVTAADEIRGDADTARVVVDLRFPSGIDAAITRSINRKGKVSLEAKLPDREITSQDELDELLNSEFGADTHVLAQLTVMIHGGAVETFQGEFDLQDHLAGVFGVTPLFEAARTAKTVADRAASALRKVKVTQRSEKRAKEDIVAELQSVIDGLAETNEARDQLAEAINETQTSIRIGADWSRFHAGMGERQEKLAAIAEQASSHLERPVTAETLVDVLTQVDQEITESVAAADNKAASARGKTELIQAAMADLDNADAVCPTCLRPLSEHDANRAEQEHTKHLQELEAEIAREAAKAEEARTAGAEIHALLEHVRSLPVPLEPETQIAETQLKTAENLLVKQNEEVQALDKKLAVLANTGATLQSALEEFDAEQERMRELEILYREEGIALAAHEALIETGNAITQDYIEPLAAEIESRWKTMFGAGGLNLSPEGHITRQVGSRTLEFGSLSGGEKVWALLLTRLLIAAASTKAPFIWLDEPLEHLDPRLRKVVAGTLAKASAGAGLRQVIVTTYESELARQLMEDVPSASLIYVTASE
jgi:DNA repair exonuclease SbcCD ATPase subunit